MEDEAARDSALKTRYKAAFNQVFNTPLPSSLILRHLSLKDKRSLLLTVKVCRDAVHSVITKVKLPEFPMADPATWPLVNTLAVKSNTLFKTQRWQNIVSLDMKYASGSQAVIGDGPDYAVIKDVSCLALLTRAPFWGNLRSLRIGLVTDSDLMAAFSAWAPWSTLKALTLVMNASQSRRGTYDGGVLFDFQHCPPSPLTSLTFIHTYSCVYLSTALESLAKATWSLKSLEIDSMLNTNSYVLLPTSALEAICNSGWPLEKLTVQVLADALQPLLSKPLTTIRHLDLSLYKCNTAEHAQTIFSSLSLMPSLENLDLYLSFNSGATAMCRTFEALFLSASLPKLTGLRFNYIGRLPDGSVENISALNAAVLKQAPWLRQLNLLTTEQQRLGQLAESAEHLKVLKFAGGISKIPPLVEDLRISLPINALPGSVHSLELGNTFNLKKLYLTFGSLNLRDITDLLASPFMPQLVHLDISKSQLRHEGARQIVLASHRSCFKSLEVLDLVSCHLGTVGVGLLLGLHGPALKAVYVHCADDESPGNPEQCNYAEVEERLRGVPWVWSYFDAVGE